MQLAPQLWQKLSQVKERELLKSVELNYLSNYINFSLVTI